MRNWTPEERTKQAEAIRQQKPWLKSTGPKTAAGKVKSRKNAQKHGFRSEDMNAIRFILRAQARRIKTLKSRKNLGEFKKRTNELVRTTNSDLKPSGFELDKPACYMHCTQQEQDK